MFAPLPFFRSTILHIALHNAPYLLITSWSMTSTKKSSKFQRYSVFNRLPFCSQQRSPSPPSSSHTRSNVDAEIKVFGSRNQRCDFHRNAWCIQSQK